MENFAKEKKTHMKLKDKSIWGFKEEYWSNLKEKSIIFF